MGINIFFNQSTENLEYIYKLSIAAMYNQMRNKQNRKSSNVNFHGNIAISF